MSLVCSLSNEVPEQAVISPVSGHVFEKRLIVKYLIENGRDPINNEPLTEDQLIEIKTNSLVKPKPPSATSIPALLKSLQDEWDSVMLHSFTLRQQLQTARQELSHSLYQHDAACRVIARLTKEVAAAREALATLKPHHQANVNQNNHNNQFNNDPQTMYASETNGDTTSMKTSAPIGISEEVEQRLQEKSATLTQLRKQRGKKQPEDLATVENIKAYRCIASQIGLHSASVPGITSLDIKFTDSTKIVTGGNDKHVIVFNTSSERILATLKGHTKKVTQVIYHPEEDVIISSSADATIRVWSVAQQQQVQFLKVHDSGITGISLHPLGDYLLSCSIDEHWAFSNIKTGQNLLKVSSAASAPTTDGDSSQLAGGTPVALMCAKFHPDGLIFGTGTADSVIKIWDLKTRNNLANFTGHNGSITALSFSENGYYLATAGEDSVIKLWDLRKLKNFKTIEFEDKFEIKDLMFDYSGSYLACAGSDVRVYQSKSWDLLRIFNEHTQLATSVRFGTNVKTILSSSLDKTLKIYGLE